MKITLELTDDIFAAIVDAVAAKVSPTPRKPLTVKQFASATGLHLDTVYRQIQAGGIRTVPDIGTKKLIPASEVTRLIGDSQPGTKP